MRQIILLSCNHHHDRPSALKCVRGWRHSSSLRLRTFVKNRAVPVRTRWSGSIMKQIQSCHQFCCAHYRSVSKLSVDAQLTEVRDWRWAKINRNIGPFLNSPDDNEEINCILDRGSLWVDRDGLHSMWMESTKFIAKGSYLHWRYDPRAGPGGFWKFS